MELPKPPGIIVCRENGLCWEKGNPPKLSALEKIGVWFGIIPDRHQFKNIFGKQ